MSRLSLPQTPKEDHRNWQYIVDRLNDVRTPSSSSSTSQVAGAIIQGSSGNGSTTSGIIAIIQQTVVAGINTIVFTNSLSSPNYGGFLILSDSENVLVDFAELRMRATARTNTDFSYTASQAGTLYGFAIVAI
jgi:hypothetical protein